MSVQQRLVRFIALSAVSAALLVAFPAFAAAADKSDSSEVTQADCDAGRIKDKEGKTVTGKKCENLVGQRVNLADTGFDAWLVALLGAGLIGGAVVLRRRVAAPTA